MKKEFIGNIVGLTDEAKDCKKVTISLQEDFQFIPGQYCMLAFPENLDERRAFSITYAEDGMLVFYIKRHQDFTKRLFESELGEKIHILGPYGRFILPEEEQNIVFIAGGIGITPLYSMILETMQKKYTKRIDLFYSAKRKAEMCLLKEISSLNADNLHSTLYFTQEGDKRISAEDVQNKVSNIQDVLVYLCGPASMMDPLRDDLITKGISDDRIKLEEF